MLTPRRVNGEQSLGVGGFLPLNMALLTLHKLCKKSSENKFQNHISVNETDLPFLDANIFRFVEVLLKTS